MKAIFDLQIATVQHSAFERDVETLVERYIPPHKAPANDAETAECFVSPTRLHHGADHLFGREAELALFLGNAAYGLRALGRLTEALEPIRIATNWAARKKGWEINAAVDASNLSELELMLGEVAGAVAHAEQSVTYADRSGDATDRAGERPWPTPRTRRAPGRSGGALPRGREDGRRAPALPAAAFVFRLPVLRPAPRRP